MYRSSLLKPVVCYDTQGGIKVVHSTKIADQLTLKVEIFWIVWVGLMLLQGSLNREEAAEESESREHQDKDLTSHCWFEDGGRGHLPKTVSGL